MSARNGCWRCAWSREPSRGLAIIESTALCIAEESPDIEGGSRRVWSAGRRVVM